MLTNFFQINQFEKNCKHITIEVPESIILRLVYFVMAVMEPSTKLKLYVLMNSDAKFTPGQACAQGIHIARILTNTMVDEMHTQMEISETVKNYNIWIDDEVVIVKQATSAELEELAKIPSVFHFVDEVFLKHLQKKETIITMVAFPPGSVTEEEMRGYKLAK